jgi:hypothetical protein
LATTRRSRLQLSRVVQAKSSKRRADWPSTGCMLGIAVVFDWQPYRAGKLNYVPLIIVSLATCLLLSRHYRH